MDNLTNSGLFEKRKKILFSIRFYSVFAYITGLFLLLLVVEMLIKYIPWNGDLGVGYEIFFNAEDGIYLVSAIEEFVDSAVGINLSIAVLIIHGWLYVIYLISDFLLYHFLKWPVKYFFIIALGGVIPFLSFVIERIMSKKARKFMENCLEDIQKRQDNINKLKEIIDNG